MNRFPRGRKNHNSDNTPLPPNRKRNRKRSSKPSNAKEDKVARPKRAKKIILATVRLIVSLAITVATVWAGLQAYRHITTSDYFAATDLKITGLRRLSKAEVLKTAGISSEDNIFRVDMERAKVMLENHTWIQEAQVRRRLPRTVEIGIMERRAQAIVLFDVPYLIDEEGEVFKRWARGDPIPAPILTGFAREQFINDREGVQDAIRDAIDLAARYRATGLERVAPLAEIHHEVDGDFSLTIQDDSVYVRFGSGPYRVKLKRLATLLGRLGRDRVEPAVIYFDNDVRPDRVTVKLKPSKKTKENHSDKSNYQTNLQKRVSKI